MNNTKIFIYNFFVLFLCLCSRNVVAQQTIFNVNYFHNSSFFTKSYKEDLRSKLFLFYSKTQSSLLRLLGYIESNTCNIHSIKYKINLDLENNFSQDKISLLIDKINLNNVNAVIGDTVITVVSPTSSIISLLNTACLQWTGLYSNNYLFKYSDVVDEFSNIIKHALTYCSNTYLKKSGGYFCDLNYSTSHEAARVVLDIERKLLKHFKRIPYILMRRLSLTKHLARVTSVSQDRFKAQIWSFCSVIEKSLLNEKPLIMRQKKWVDAICHTKKDIFTKRKILHMGLDIAANEISYLFLVLKKSTKFGFLRFAINDIPINKNNLWVKLSPNEDVYNHIKKLQFSNVSSHKLFNVCWHPLFKSNDLSIAINMGLISNGSSNINCNKKIKSNYAVKYITKAVAGETSFVVSNGHSKKLQLLIGSYHYQVYFDQITLSDRQYALKRPYREGIIKWHNKRPYLTIRGLNTKKLNFSSIN